MQGGTTGKQDNGTGRPGRAWWQWCVAGLLFGGAGLMAVYSYVPGLRGNPTVRRVEPHRIVVSAELAEVDAVPAAPGDLAGSNVLIVTYDTTRADHIGCYGYDKAATPALDRIAGEGVLFSEATAPSPTTLPSHSSLMTGLYPFHHGARANNSFRLGEENLTLAEIMAGHGYATAAFVSAFVLDDQFGLDQGFDEYDARFEPVRETDLHEIAQRPADQTTRLAEAWLREHSDKPFALWVHYYDPHFPYEAPKPFSDDHTLPYDAEIAFMDFHLGRLLAALDELQLTDTTLVVVAGDHGEGLGQHDEWFHSTLVYDSTLRIPLVMRCGRKLGGGVQVSRPVSLVDVMPTILSLLGFAVPEGLDGIDLTGEPDGPRPIFSETLQGLADHGWAALLGVQEGSTKYIYGPYQELYDLAADPFEEDDLIEREPRLAATMLQRLHGFYGDDLESASMAAATHQISSEDREKLASLGYMGTMSDVTAHADRPHPRDMIPLLALTDQALMIESREGLDATIVRLQEICEQHPSFATAFRYLGDKYVKRGDLQDAEDAYTRTAELRPTDIQPLMALAGISMSQRHFDDAIELYREVLSRDPSHFGALNDLGRALRRMGEFSDAADVLIMALSVRPNDRSLPDLIAETLASLGRSNEAIELFRSRLEAEPNLPMIRNALAGILVSAPLLNYEEAIAMLRRGIELAPDKLELANNLAFILVVCPDPEIRRPMEAAVMMEHACQATGYKDPRYMHTLAMVYANLFRFDEAITVAQRALDIAIASDRKDFAQMVQAIGLSLQQYRTAQEQGLSGATRLQEPQETEPPTNGGE